jgi:predicted ATPase/DNA-binding SARP family transcriptional activator
VSRVEIYLLGPPRIELDNEPVHISRRKAVALLAYLAVEGGLHRRDSLLALLSPEFEPSRARNDLRRTLSLLNRKLGKGWLVADRETVRLRQAPSSTPLTLRDASQLDSGLGQPESAHRQIWVDVHVFRRRLAQCDAHAHGPGVDEVCAECVASLEEAVELYRDDFLAGFALPGSLAFDEWQFFRTEALRGEVAGALERLAHALQSQGEHERAISYLRRWLELDPLHEPAHRQLMGLYVQAGRRNAALRQYRTCVRVLEEELGVPPSRETTTLYEQVRSQRAAVATAAVPKIPPPARVPAFLTQEEAPTIDRPVFVARERELARLDGYLEQALGGHGQVVFLTGGPGRGKTALMRAFARRAMETRPDLLVAAGGCNAYSGTGDPYLPFRKILDLLTGGVESRWAAGSLSRDQARRLWEATPVALQALQEHGPHLINTFVAGSKLVSRATAALAGDGAPRTAAPNWLAPLAALSEREPAHAGDLPPSALYEQYTNVLGALSARHPLLLTQDDLQWADNGSIGLLFHLGLRLADAGSRILIVSAYRPEEVALERGGERHPLQKVLSEFKRRYGDVWTDLARADQAGGRRFVEAYLDAAPNRLDEEFRKALFERTGVPPLFTVELLQGMQERGDLLQAGDGAWVEGPALDWTALPARVEAVVAERVGRLDEELRDLLAVASVEGERFTAQVVAQVKAVAEREMLRMLSRELGTRHRLVREAGEERVGGQLASRYDFAHALYQEYLYSTLGTGQRRLLHGEVAKALEAMWADQIDQAAPSLAYHYAAAQHTEKAIEYALRAARNARLAYANEEALTYYQRALELQGPAGEYVSERQDGEWRLEALRELGCVSFLLGKYPQAEKYLREAIAFGREVGAPTRERARIYYWLGETLVYRHRFDEIVPLGEEGLALLEQDPSLPQAVEHGARALMYQTIVMGHRLTHDYQKEREFTLRAAELVQAVNYVEEQRTLYKSIILLHQAEKNVEQALKWNRIFEERATGRQDLRALATAHFHLGNILAGRWIAREVLGGTGDLKGALAQYQEALRLLERIGDTGNPFGAGSALHGLGQAHLAQGDKAKALRCFQE